MENATVEMAKAFLSPAPVTTPDHSTGAVMTVEAPTAEALEKMSATQAIKAMTKESVELTATPGGVPKVSKTKEEIEEEATRIVNEHLPKLMFVEKGYSFHIPVIPQRVRKKLFPGIAKRTIEFSCDIVNVKHPDGSIEERLLIRKDL